MAKSAIARRSSRAPARAPSRRSAVARRVGASIARTARTAATGASGRVKANIRNKTLLVAPLGAVAGAFIQAKVPQLPQIQGVPPQLVIGGAGVAVGLLLKGKLAENVLLGAIGPLCAGASSLALRFASGGTLAGEFSGGPFGYGDQPIAVAGEFDDIAV
jgi:hypothetical protein